MTKVCLYHIEDNEADRRLLAFALHAQGVPMELHAAHDGEHAAKVLATAAAGQFCLPHLVILDLNLPKRSGIEILAAIREDPTLQAARVVVLTSSDSPADRKACEALGVLEYLRKPMDFDGFMELGHRLLQLAQV
jgi:CheY-like chemotaxis protein